MTDNEERVTAKAFYKACSNLNIDNNIQFEIASISREHGDPRLLFLKVLQFVYSIGNDDEFVKHWLRTENHAFADSPLGMCKSSEGLVTVLEYLGQMTTRIQR